MNFIDIILGILLLLAAIGGFRKGLIIELASLVALILGIWGAIHFSYITSNFLIETFGWKWDHLSIVSFIITFIAIVVVVHIIGKTLTKVAETVLLGFVNKLAGLVFGFLKGALILSIVLVVFDHINEGTGLLSEDTKTESRIYEPLKNFAPSVFPFIDSWKEENKSKKEESILERII